ncbi:AAA family ATPase [Desulfurobacterium crinifex]
MEKLALTTAVKMLTDICYELKEYAEMGIEAIGLMYGVYGIGKTKASQLVADPTSEDHIPFVARVKCDPGIKTPSQLVRAIASAIKAPPSRNYHEGKILLKTRIKHKAQYVFVLDEASFVLRRRETALAIKDILEEYMTPFVLLGNEELPALVEKYGGLNERVKRRVNLDVVTELDIKAIFDSLSIPQEEELIKTVYGLVKKKNASILKLSAALKLAYLENKKLTKKAIEEALDRVILGV